MNRPVADRPETTGRLPTSPTAVDWVLVLLLSLLAAVIAVFGIFFLPIYRGSVPAPASAVVVAIAVAWLPRASYRLTHLMPAALAPVVVWAAATIGLYATGNSLYSGAAVVWQGWQFLLLIGLGALAAAISVGLLWGEHLRAQLVGPPAPRRSSR